MINPNITYVDKVDVSMCETKRGQKNKIGHLLNQLKELSYEQVDKFQVGIVKVTIEIW